MTVSRIPPTGTSSIAPRCPLETVAEILALGYFRYRCKLAGGDQQKEPQSAENPLDDVTPRGRVGTGEGRTPETGGDA